MMTIILQKITGSEVDPDEEEVSCEAPYYMEMQEINAYPMCAAPAPSHGRRLLPVWFREEISSWQSIKLIVKNLEANPMTFDITTSTESTQWLPILRRNSQCALLESQVKNPSEGSLMDTYRRREGRYDR